MKLTKKGLDAINNLETRTRLSLELKCSESWIRRCISINKDNGPLALVSAVRVIMKQTGLSEEEILTEEVEEVSDAQVS